jgi:hypothetical protein
MILSNVFEAVIAARLLLDAKKEIGDGKDKKTIPLIGSSNLSLVSKLQSVLDVFQKDAEFYQKQKQALLDEFGEKQILVASTKALKFRFVENNSLPKNLRDEYKDKKIYMVPEKDIKSIEKDITRIPVDFQYILPESIQEEYYSRLNELESENRTESKIRIPISVFEKIDFAGLIPADGLSDREDLTRLIRSLHEITYTEE